MSKPNKGNDFWHRLSAGDACEGYCIPRAVAYDGRNAFYLDCIPRASVPDDVTCRFVGLVANAFDPGLVEMYPGYFSLADLFDLYGYEALESGEFNFLDVIRGIVSLNGRMAAELADILAEYASSMPGSVSIGECFFEELDASEIARYRFHSFSGHVREVYRYVSRDHDGEFAEDMTSLLSFTRARERPTLFGMAVTRFRESAFRSDPGFNVLMNGRGSLVLTRKALRELSSMIAEKADRIADTN